MAHASEPRREPAARWALPAAALFFGAGIVVGEAVHPSAALLAALAAVLAAAVASAASGSWRRDERVQVATLLVGFAIAGLARGATLPREEEVERAVAPWLDRDVMVVGREVTLPDGNAGECRFTLDAEAIRDERGWHPVRARIRVVAEIEPARLRVTRRVALRGRLRAIEDSGNPGESPRAAALHRAGIAATLAARDPAWIVPLAPAHPDVPLSLADRVWRWRVATATRIEASVPAPHAAVLEALLIGLTGGVPPDLAVVFVRTGTAHVLAVSGLNVALVVMASYWPARWLLGSSRRLAEHGAASALAAATSFAAALAYVLLAGAEAPVVRSVVASGCALAAAWLGRPGAALASLALAFLGLTAVAPRSLWSISFQLSFLATAGLVLAGERFAAVARAAPEHDWVARLARAAIASTVATVVATWVTGPITASVFGRWTALGLVANPLAVPLLGTAAVPVGLAGVACAAILPRLAPWLFRLAEVPVAAGLGILDGIAGWHGLDGTTPRPPALVAVIATALAVAALALERRRAARLAASATVAILVAAALAPRVRARLRTAPELTFLAVGHGDAAVASLPRGRTWLVDAGPWAEARGGGGVSVVVPALEALGATRVEVLVASHLQLDHVGGLGAVLDRFAIGEIWLPARVARPSWLARDLERAARRGTAIVELSRTSAPFERDGVTVEVLHPPPEAAGLSPNDASLVLRLRTPGGTVLFTGDIEREGERLLVAAAPDARADVLKVPHHGSATSSSFALLRAVMPRLAVVSAPRGSLHHPSSEVVRRLEALGARVLDTGRVGAVTVRLAPPAPSAVARRGSVDEPPPP